MKYAIGKWIAPIVIVEVDPDEFDGEAGEALLMRLRQHFMVDVALITPDWESSDGIKARGLACPSHVLVEHELIWRELVLPPEAEIPF